MESSDAIIFLTQREAAVFLRLSGRTLERMRMAGNGPPFRAFGRRRLYARSDLLTWADAQRRTSTSARQPAALRWETSMIARSTRKQALDAPFAKSKYSRMRLVIERKAAKALSRMPPKVVAAMRADLEEIAARPFARHPNVERLKALRDIFRLRHGDWRAVYRVDRKAGIMFVERIAPRGEVYKR